MHRFFITVTRPAFAFSLPDTEIVIQHFDNLLSFIIFLVFLPHGMYNQYHLMIQFAWGGVPFPLKNDIVLSRIEATEPGTKISVRGLASELDVSEGTVYKP